MYKAWRQRKKKAACVLPVQRYTAYFWTHFHFDHSLAQRAATLQTCLNYTASNIVNTQPRNSCIQACKLCKKSYLASFGPFFIPACILRFRMTKSLKAERPGSESIMLQIQPQQLARFELRSQQNTFTWHHAWQQPLWRHLLGNRWRKTLISRLLGMYPV